MKKMSEIQKYDYLDHLRGIAILGVLWTHLHYLYLSSWNTSIWDTIFKIWWMGVSLFFLISAYTLCLSSSTREIWETHHWKHFFLRRFFRIYPLYFCIIVLVFILFCFIPHFFSNLPIDANIWNLLTHLTFTFGFFPKYISSMYIGEWSLFNEVIFYLVFPLLYPFFNKIKFSIACLITIIMALVSYLANSIAHQYGTFDLYGTPITHMFTFCLWILIFKINHSLKVPWKFLIGINITIYIILTLCYINFGYLHVYIPFIINLWLTLLMFMRKIYYIPSRSYIGKFLKFTGNISYSLYLLNYWFFILMGSLYLHYVWGGQGWYILEYCYIVCIIWFLYWLSYLTYHYIEQPWIARWKAIIQKYF